MLEPHEAETHLNETIAQYQEILTKTPQEIGADPYLLMLRSTAIGMIKMGFRLIYNTERPEYPCMENWEIELARLGIEPWATRHAAEVSLLEGRTTRP